MRVSFVFPLVVAACAAGPSAAPTASTATPLALQRYYGIGGLTHAQRARQDAKLDRLRYELQQLQQEIDAIPRAPATSNSSEPW